MRGKCLEELEHGILKFIYILAVVLLSFFWGFMSYSIGIASQVPPNLVEGMHVVEHSVLPEDSELVLDGREHGHSFEAIESEILLEIAIPVDVLQIDFFEVLQDADDPCFDLSVMVGDSLLRSPRVRCCRLAF